MAVVELYCRNVYLLNVSVPVVLSVSCSRRPFSKSILLLDACFRYVPPRKDKPYYSNLTSARLSPGSESVFRSLSTLASMAPHIVQTNSCSLLKKWHKSPSCTNSWQRQSGWKPVRNCSGHIARKSKHGSEIGQVEVDRPAGD